MSNADFEAMVALIGAMAAAIAEMNKHEPFSARWAELSYDQDMMIEEFRKRMVL